MCLFFLFQHLFARVQNVSWPEVGFLLSYCFGLMFFWVCLVLFCFLIIFFFGGCPLLKCWHHFTAVNKITAYALTLISSVTASSKLIPSVNAFLTKTCKAKNPKICKCYNRESNPILLFTFSEV